MRIKNLPKIELSKNQKIWLEEAWRLLRTSGRKVTYQRIRANTIDKNGENFNPYGIDNRLASEYVSSITLLGLFSIDSYEEVIKIANQTLNHIKSKLIENPDFKQFKICDLAEEMNLNIKDVGLVFYFLQYVNGFYDGAGSSGEHSEIWYERYEINSSHTFDNYMQFSNFEDSINDHYYKIANKKERTVLNTDNPNFKNKYELNSEKVLFVDLGRIKELEALRTDQFDVSRLIRKCKELNVSYNSECFFATALLTRAIIDHVPPIFGK